MTKIAGKQFGDRIVLACVTIFALVWITPLIWVFMLSFKPNDFLMAHTNILFSPPFTLKNYNDILGTSAVSGWILNSLIVSIATTFLTLIVASLAGYGFARTEFHGKNILFILVLAGLAVPEQAIVIPLHRMFADLDLHNTYGGLILPRLAAPFGVYLMTQYFKAIPKDIEEAALLDSTPRWKIFLRVVLPLSIPAASHAGHLHLPELVERLPVAADLCVQTRDVHAHAGPSGDADQPSHNPKGLAT